MTAPYSYKNTIAKAAALASGTRLSELYSMCENQETVSTKKLLTIVEKMHDDSKLDAIHFRALADKLQSTQSQWQPIETAPKNQNILLGLFNNHNKWRTMRGSWFSKEEIDEYWENPEDFEAGWYEVSVEADDTPNCWPTAPSHWMPLPEPPTKEI